ncbi:DUF2213 domain-containing protein [Escherichia marmotae]|uniref:DUF2213 domain-containing protein n=1 Tax=Escherichia marmotae TaxID=1499973 RepID=UPI00175E93BE|nr:DUF2213 domain-containing protein [Escherichia marmotae]HAI8714149.1 DUF2213 domain-containing protein [Escherichia coli]MEC9626139.1 DUF2213 domain-containing protein [Escherichia marmotae]MED0363737.1 DUF2213 domain-containing protein [Escherichia marmotae]MED8777108.1 DUF2213 domain-containing protein [Escherichia marmotae]MED9200620.1 DUF2213 domain-containing protein [Escherichia marmotae]
MKRNRVNVLTVINSASNITTETIDGREHIVVHGVVPIVDDIVMNRRFYPSAEIQKSYNTLERNPMPLDHPVIDGENVSASDPRAVNNYHVGAWFQNARHENGRVIGDMYVDRRYAENSEKGKRLVERLDDMAAEKNVEPIHISTGLDFCSIATNGESKRKRYNEICTNLQFDHVAILLDKPGAGTPKEGVGIFVNADGSKSEIECVNLAEASEPDEESTLSLIFNQLKALVGAKEDQNPMKNMIANALKAAGKTVDGLNDEQLLQAYNSQLEETAKKKKEDAEKKAEEEEEKKKKANNSESIPEWFKPFVTQLESIAINSKKDSDSKRSAVKTKFGLTDIAVNALDGAALDEMFAQTVTAAPIHSGFQQFNVNQDDQWKDYDLNKIAEEK